MPTYQASTPAPAAMITAATRPRPARMNFHHAAVGAATPRRTALVGNDRHRAGGQGNGQADGQCHRVAAADDGQQRASGSNCGIQQADDAGRVVVHERLQVL